MNNLLSRKELKLPAHSDLKLTEQGQSHLLMVVNKMQGGNFNRLDLLIKTLLCPGR